jgi:hypothetical protein
VLAQAAGGCIKMGSQVEDLVAYSLLESFHLVNQPVQNFAHSLCSYLAQQEKIRLKTVDTVVGMLNFLETDIRQSYFKIQHNVLNGAEDNKFHLYQLCLLNDRTV